MPNQSDQRAHRLLLLRRFALRWPVVARLFSICFLLSAGAVLLVPNTYQTRFKVMLRLDASSMSDIKGHTMFSADDLRRSRLNTEIQLITADQVLRQVVAEGHLEDSVGLKHRPLAVRQQAALAQLEKDLSVNTVGSASVIEAVYEAAGPEQAADVLRRVFDAYLRSHAERVATDDYPSALQAVNGLRKSSSRQAAVIRSPAREHNLQRIGQAHQTSQQAKQHAVSGLVILEQPFTPELASGPRRSLLLALAFVGSLLIGTAAAICLELLSGRVKSPAAVAQLTGVPVLASVPSHAAAPPFRDAFPALYLAMQRPRTSFFGRLS